MKLDTPEDVLSFEAGALKICIHASLTIIRLFFTLGEMLSFEVGALKICIHAIWTILRHFCQIAPQKNDPLLGAMGFKVAKRGNFENS